MRLFASPKAETQTNQAHFYIYNVSLLSDKSNPTSAKTAKSEKLSAIFFAELSQPSHFWSNLRKNEYIFLKKKFFFV